MGMSVLELLSQQFTNLASGGAGAFGGAWFAFRLQRRYAERQERRQQAASIRQAQFALNQQHDHAYNIRKTLEPLKDDPDRFLNLDPTFGGPSIRLDLASLGFILQSQRSMVLTELFTAETEYATFAALVEEHSHLRRELSARLSDLERSGWDVDAHPSDEVEKKIGRDLMGALRSATEGLYDVTKRALNANRRAFQSLTEYAAAELPEEGRLAIGGAMEQDPLYATSSPTSSSAPPEKETTRDRPDYSSPLQREIKE
jgi:hypothetical protein